MGLKLFLSGSASRLISTMGNPTSIARGTAAVAAAARSVVSGVFMELEAQVGGCVHVGLFDVAESLVAGHERVGFQPKRDGEHHGVIR